jgi:hypothetical protein
MKLAHWLARKAVKDEWQANGLRPSAFKPGEVNRAADAYLDQHRATLLLEARAYVERFAQRAKR